MSNKQKFNKAFMTAFDIEESILGSDLKYESIQEWDSIGHMQLIAELEDSFEISMEMDDIIDFSSYEKGKEILVKYNIEF
jgi:acyl carrier protein|tara:strand:+ start:607 stop:846 length:240 start_codon:yes stop_codon:yes gene_type:complete